MNILTIEQRELLITISLFLGGKTAELYRRKREAEIDEIGSMMVVINRVCKNETYDDFDKTKLNAIRMYYIKNK